MSYSGACSSHAVIGFVPGCDACVSVNTTICKQHSALPDITCVVCYPEKA